MPITNTKRKNAMKKIIIALALSILLATPAFAATAYWTGEMEFVTTVTGKHAYRCEYSCRGFTFTKIFRHRCPTRIEVE
jgi:hypothetical protein